MANLFAFIDGAIWDLDVTIMNVNTGKIVQKLQPRANKKFVASIPKIFSPKKFNAVIYNVGNVEGHDFPNLLEFRKAIKEKLDNLKIPNHYFTKDRYTPTQCLVPANISAKDGDHVVIVMGSKVTVFVTVVKFTKFGWKVLSDESLCSLLFPTPQSLREEILGLMKPKNIIVTAADFLDSTPKYLIDTFKSCGNLKVIDRRDYFAEAIMEVYKNLMDKSYIKNFVVPTLEEEEYEIGFKYGKNGAEKHKQIVAKVGELLPFSKAVYSPKSSLEFYLSYTDKKEKKTSILETFELKKDCHQNKIILKIDEESVASFEVQPIIFDGIKELPSTLNDLAFEDKIPVIGFYDNSSVICVPKKDDGNGYKFVDEWNGMYGKQLLIAFDDETPKFCDSAEKAYQKKPSFVISDILSVMSYDQKELLQKPNKMWKFKITKDSENPILLEFDDFDGGRKGASPAFLMAMLLKEHVKAIKKEIGEKPVKLRFCLFTPYSEAEEERKKRIEKEIEESCKLLKIECSFVIV